jgi:hypothetical protein
MTEDTLWKHFSKFIRLRDRIEGSEYCKCASCSNTYKWKDMDAGHFISRRHKSTKYNEKNVLAQCIACNRFNQGNQINMGIEVDRRYGKGTSNMLLVQSRQSHKMSRFEIDELSKYYRNLNKINE